MIPILALLPALLLFGAAQQEPDIEQEWARLRGELAADDQRAPVDNRGRHIKLLTRFVERWDRPEHAAGPEMLGARSRLGGLHLAGVEADQALVQFAAILESAPEDELDARGRALYGKAQALLLKRLPDAAQAVLNQLHLEFAGTRWAAYAKIALEHLADDDLEPAQIGKLAPEIGPRLDRVGKSRKLAELHGEPALLLFLSPFDENSIEGAERWIRAAREAGLSAERILVFAVDAETEDLARLVGDSPLPGVLFPVPAGFLDPVLLSYRVQALPSAVLIGPDGALLAENPPPARLRQALAKLKR